MDKRAVIEQLESIRRYCESMHQKDGSIVWWDDAKALTEAIKALSLDINKNEKEGINRMNKVKVIIEHEDGHKQELNGDTVICFTISKTGEFLDGKVHSINAQAAFIGRVIPDPITIGNLIASTVEKSSSGKALAGFNLHRIAEVLEAKSKEIKSSLNEKEKKEYMDGLLKNLFEAAFQK